MPGKSLKSKDVKPREKASRASGAKKSAGMLPKILSLAAGQGSLQAQRVRCGKANCRCASGDLHEGYHYFFSRVGGRQYKVYVRRGDAPAVQEAIRARVVRRAQWRSELSEARAFLRNMMRAAVGVKL